MISFQQESLIAIRDEIEATFPLRWQEVAIFPGEKPLDPDWETYETLDEAGSLVCATARDDGELVGFWLYVLFNNLHHKGEKVAQADSFWTKPEYRKGTFGLRLLAASEKFCAEQGATRIYNAARLRFKPKGKRDIGGIFKRFGYEADTTCYIKKVG